MSTPLSNLMFGLIDDSREVELIRSISEKTRQGKIPWAKQATALTATIPGFQINFVLSPMIALTQHATWQLLTVRDRSGNELVKVTNGGALAIVLAGGSGSTLVAAADELFKVVNSAASDDLDRAINAIKNL